MSSSSAVVEISRSKSRYHDQDALLDAYINCGGYTAKEVAVEALGWNYEQYANSPKRAFDLFRLGYLEQLEDRICRRTGKSAHTFKITEKGLKHLCKSTPVAGVADVTVSHVIGQRGIGQIKGLLGG